MLYNPKWDIDTLQGLRDWLSKQPADGTYEWQSCRKCVVGQYLADHGRWIEGAYAVWIYKAEARDAVYECFGHGRTFGFALAKLDRWLAGH